MNRSLRRLLGRCLLSRRPWRGPRRARLRFKHGTVAFDAFSSVAAGTGTLSWTHTPVGTPKAVAVGAVGTATTDEFTTASYGALSLGEVAGSPNVLAGGEGGNVSAWFAGSGIPTGAQTVTVNVTGAGSKRAGAVTLTAAADCEIVDVDATINSASQANPSVTLALAGRVSFAWIVFFSGQNAVGGITPLASWTGRLEHDFGTDVAGWYTYNTIDSADVTAGWTQTADDAAAIAMAISEVQAPMPTEEPDYDVTMPRPTRRHGEVVSVW